MASKSEKETRKATWKDKAEALYSLIQELAEPGEEDGGITDSEKKGFVLFTAEQIRDAKTKRDLKFD